MSTVSRPAMHTFCILFGRAPGGWRFVAFSPHGEIARISAELSDDEMAAITIDRATWPAWVPVAWMWWARKRKWAIVCVVGASCDLDIVVIP